MSYSIHYGPEEPCNRKSGFSWFSIVGVVLILTVCLLALSWYLPQQVSQFREALLPWTRAEVTRAFAELCENVKDGKSLNNAVTDFCLEIIHDAELAK